MFDRLLEDRSFWSGRGQLSDTVLSTRLRLIRNQADIPFGLKQTEDDAEKIEKPVEEFVSQQNAQGSYWFARVADLNPVQRRFLRERNIISQAAEESATASVLYRFSDAFSMTVNASDHYNFQIMRPGLAVYEGYGELMDLDNAFNGHIPYAFSDKFGYLASCIDDTGSGLKVSALMHLPVLGIMGTIPEVVRMVGDTGASMKPVTETDSINYGSFYLVGNSASVGISESGILEIVDDAVRMVAGLETESRDDYYMDCARSLYDRIWRAYGLLTHAYSLPYIEALENLSAVRLGVLLSVIKKIQLYTVNDLFVKIQPAHLSEMSGDKCNTDEEYDNYRARYVRTILAGTEEYNA